MPEESQLLPHAAHIDGFEVRCVSDASTQEIAFRNKELSIFTISNAETLANYKDNDEYQVVSYPDGRITFMEINPNSEAMSTMEARQAVIYALDLDALVYGTYGDEALCRTATSILSTVSMFYNPEITNYKQDLDKRPAHRADRSEGQDHQDHLQLRPCGSGGAGHYDQEPAGRCGS